MARKDTQINIDSILQKVADSKSAEGILQEAIYLKTREQIARKYERFYQSLVDQVMFHLRSGFGGASRGGMIAITVLDEDGKAAGGISQYWDQLGAGYLGTKTRINKKYGTADKFWVFRRNLQASSANSARMRNVSVDVTSRKVKRDGVLVRGKNRLTIRYSTGLKFSTLPPPLNELVRKPFVNGNTQGVEVWTEAEGLTGKKGLKVLAFVEGRRPFIVELSGAVGRLARLRLGITT